MRRYLIRILSVGIPAFLLYVILSLDSLTSSREKRHKRSALDDMEQFEKHYSELKILDNIPEEKWHDPVGMEHFERHFTELKNLENIPTEDKEWIDEAINRTAGTLVCDRKKKPAITSVLETEIKDDEKINEFIRDLPIDMRGRAKESLTAPRMKSGCCPAGDKNGILYHSGFSCCVDRVYDVSTHFCCVKNVRKSGTISKLLEMNKDDLDYCFPSDSLYYCREKDLGMQFKQPMKANCERSPRNHPIHCQFECPDGSKPKDVTDTRCEEGGVWDSKPVCCEGCPTQTKLDVWLVVEVNQLWGQGRFKQLLLFIKSLFSYMPVSQKGVRVGITIFNKVVFADVGVWDMSKHNSHAELHADIDELPIEGAGSSTGAALRWVASNAFQSKFGDREEVPNQVVAILWGKPEDNIFEGALELKTISKVLAIAIGDKMSDGDLLAIGSGEKYIHRVPNFKSLMSASQILYKTLCGENCIISKNREKI